jgi:hypothetical protein
VLVVVDIAAVDESFGVIGVEPDRLVEVLDRAIILALVEVGDARL